MQLGFVGLGRMGANMVRRLLEGGHQCVVHDVNVAAMRALSEAGAKPAATLPELVSQLQTPRVIWLMLPAGIVTTTLRALVPLLTTGDIVIDGGNSDYREAIARSAELKTRGLYFVDVGTSGGIWGLKAGFCLMVGGAESAYRHIEPLLQTLAPGSETGDGSAPAGTASQGFLYCGPAGAGHFVKMVHNGIEYGMMAAYAEGLNLLQAAGRGLERRTADAETAPLSHPEAYAFEFDLPAIAEVWRHGSVVRSWLLDLIANSLDKDPALDSFSGRVSDSGEGRWTLQAAIDLGIPTPILASALFARFSSRGEDAFANKVLSALRREFGGHQEKP